MYCGHFSPGSIYKYGSGERSQESKVFLGERPPVRAHRDQQNFWLERQNLGLLRLISEGERRNRKPGSLGVGSFLLKIFSKFWYRAKGKESSKNSWKNSFLKSCCAMATRLVSRTREERP